MERSEVQWGRTSIPYTIRRSSRRGTVSVAVEPSGTVVLTAPQSTPVPRLDRVVRQKARWIVERVRRRNELPAPLTKEFVSGETFVYLGRASRLQVREHRTALPVRLGRGRLVVTGPTRNAQDVRRALIGWYREHAEARLSERVVVWSRKLKTEVPPMRLSEQRQRWGSCTPSGELLLNWRIIQAPLSVVDYVVAHELMHRTHRHHSPAFWSALGRVMPDYERRQKVLLERGASYVW